MRFNKHRQHIKKQRHYFANKDPYSQSYGFPSSLLWMRELGHKKAEHRRIDAFELWCWRRLLRVPWTARRSNQSLLKEIYPEYALKGLMLKLKLQYFVHLMWRASSLEKTLMLGDGEGQESLACRSLWGHKETLLSDWTTTTNICVARCSVNLCLFVVMLSARNAWGNLVVCVLLLGTPTDISLTGASVVTVLSLGVLAMIRRYIKQTPWGNFEAQMYYSQILEVTWHTQWPLTEVKGRQRGRRYRSEALPQLGSESKVTSRCLVILDGLLVLNRRRLKSWLEAWAQGWDLSPP